MKSGWQIAFPREGSQEGMCKLHQPVYICEVRGQAERNAYGATALHTQVGEKLIPAHPSFPLEELRERVFGLLMEDFAQRSEEHTSELQSPDHLVCRLLLEKKKTQHCTPDTTSRSVARATSQIGSFRCVSTDHTTHRGSQWPQPRLN